MWLVQEPRHQVVPAPHARKPDAKHLGEDWQEIGDQNHAEADTDRNLRLLGVMIIDISATDLNLLPVIDEF